MPVTTTAGYLFRGYVPEDVADDALRNTPLSGESKVFEITVREVSAPGFPRRVHVVLRYRLERLHGNRMCNMFTGVITTGPPQRVLIVLEDWLGGSSSLRYMRVYPLGESLDMLSD